MSKATERRAWIPPFQDLATLSQHICCGESTIENWVRLGLFPPPKLIGGKRLWSWKVVEQHLSGGPSTQSTNADLLARITNGTRQAAQR